VAGRGCELGQESDGEIIKASLGDPVAFARIFDLYVSDLSRFVIRRAGQEAGEDLVAEIFTTAFRVRETFDETVKNARPWLYGIATNVLRHHFRTEGRARLALATLGPRLAVDQRGDDWISDTEDQTEFLRLRPLLESALAELDPGGRDALLLFAYADMTYEEVSHALGIPIGTVRSRISRSRAKLRELMHRSMETTHVLQSPISREQDRHERD
jgi:RNA polymerase sigma-70 factor (ECF subfamily)